MNGDKFFRSGLLINCFTAAVYLAYSSTSAYYYNEAKTLSTDAASFEAMFYVSIIISILSFLSLSYYSYKLIMLETENPVERVQDVAQLRDFDLEKFKKMQNVSTNVLEIPRETVPRKQTYQAPETNTTETNFGPVINSGGF